MLWKMLLWAVLGPLVVREQTIKAHSANMNIIVIILRNSKPNSKPNSENSSNVLTKARI